MAADKRDVMIRSFPVHAHEKAKIAAAARGMTIGEYLAKCVELHTRLAPITATTAYSATQNYDDIRKLVKRLELEEVRA